MKKIAVYGTLKEGQRAHSLITSAEHKSHGCAFIETKFEMKDLNAFPALVPSKTKNRILFEFYEVNDDSYQRIQAYEGYPNLFQKDEIEYKGTKYEIYVIKENWLQYTKHNTIKDGVW